MTKGAHRAKDRHQSSQRSHCQHDSSTVTCKPWTEELMNGVIHEFHAFTPELSQQMRRGLPPGAAWKNQPYLRIATSLFARSLLPPLVYRDDFADIDRCITGHGEMHFGEQLAFAALLMEGDRDMAFTSALAIAMLRKPKIRRWEQTALDLGAVDILHRPTLAYPWRCLSKHLPNAHFACTAMAEVRPKELAFLIGKRLSDFLAFCVGNCIFLPTKEALATICQDLHDDPALHAGAIAARLATTLWDFTALAGNVAGANLLSSLLPMSKGLVAAGGLPSIQLAPVRKFNAVRLYVYAMAEDEIEFAEQVAEYGYSSQECLCAKIDHHGVPHYRTFLTPPQNLLQYAVGFGHLDLLHRMEHVRGSRWFVDSRCAVLIESTIGLIPNHEEMLRWYETALGRRPMKGPLLDSAAAHCNVALFDTLNFDMVPDSSFRVGLDSAASIPMLCYMLSRAPPAVRLGSFRCAAGVESKHVLKPGQLRCIVDRMDSDSKNIEAEYLPERFEYCTVEDLEVLLEVTINSEEMVPLVLFGACGRGDVSLLNFAMRTWPEVVRSPSPWLTWHRDDSLSLLNPKPEAWLTENEFAVLLTAKDEAKRNRYYGYEGMWINSVQHAAVRGRCNALRWVRENVPEVSLFQRPPKDQVGRRLPRAVFWLRQPNVKPTEMHVSALEVLVAYACRTGDIAALDFAEECGFRGWNHRVDTVFGFTPAHIAAAHNQEQVLKRLVEQHCVPLHGAGAVRDVQGETAAYYLDPAFISVCLVGSGNVKAPTVAKHKPASNSTSRRHRWLGPNVLTFSDGEGSD